MKTFTELEKNGLIRKFHTLLSRCGMDEIEKREILRQCGVSSTKDLTVKQLVDVCDALHSMINPKVSEVDKLRKRVIASIGAYLREMHLCEDIDRIKSIACRASGANHFNDISSTKLRSIYNAFNEYRKAMTSVREITETLLKR